MQSCDKITFSRGKVHIAVHFNNRKRNCKVPNGIFQLKIAQFWPKTAKRMMSSSGNVELWQCCEILLKNIQIFTYHVTTKFVPVSQRNWQQLRSASQVKLAAYFIRKYFREHTQSSSYVLQFCLKYSKKLCARRCTKLSDEISCSSNITANVSFIPVLVFGFWSLLVTKLEKSENIT